MNDPGGSRTRDLRIKSPLLYQLSYRVSCFCRTNYNGVSALAHLSSHDYHGRPKKPAVHEDLR
jgi:hypothetical protein